LFTQAASIGLGALAGIDAHRSMWSALGKYFKSPELRQLFGRYATYCGSSPFNAPATFNLIAHVEAMGVWRVFGGMVCMAQALETLARELGVEIVTNAHAQHIEVRGGRAVAVNGDVSAVTDLVAGSRGAPARTAPNARSLSAVTWAAVGKAEGVSLVHHNVFFSDDYEAEFRANFGGRRRADRPSVYVCAQDRGDRPESFASERFFSIVNAPATGDQPESWTHEELERWQEATCSTLERCGLWLRTEASEWTTPLEFEARYPKSGGALYGPAASGALSTFSREGSQTKIAGLFLAGGSLASIATSRRAATSGSTSTA